MLTMLLMMAVMAFATASASSWNPSDWDHDPMSVLSGTGFCHNIGFIGQLNRIGL